jgi:crotonobetainyl-CoA:carnitine CoA-transferase CaiB-like acyl-CoA transferase
MDRLGIGYERLKAINPALIFCSITGYGQNGPWRDRAGHDINFLALSGAMSHSGRQANGPTVWGVQVADIGGGSFGALVGLLAAVIQRMESGVGQRVDISMRDMLLSWQAHIFSEYLVGGSIPTYESSLLNGGGTYDYYETADGRYLAVGSLEPKFWAAFCTAIERPELISLNYDSDPQVIKNLKAEISRIIARRSLEEWADIFGELDACVEPVLNVAEVSDDVQTEARNMVVEVPKLQGGKQQQIASPFHFSESTTDYHFAGVEPGAHAGEILAEIGYKKDDIHSFRLKGVLG